jgi:methyl halide transferase
MNLEHWESRYQSGDMRWEKGEAAPGLVDFLAAHPKLRRSTVLIPGCGTGHDARAWAQAGFDATGLDFAPSAIALAKERTRAAGLRAQFLRKDFLHGQPGRRFDWLFEHTLFCAISPADRETYVHAMLRWLKPGGQFLAIHYMLPCEKEPPFGVTRRELWERFSPHFELLAEWTPRSYPNRVGLEQMLWWKRKGDAQPSACFVAATKRSASRVGSGRR